MKLFAPKYYEKFKCVADRCRHSCCVGWEIDVDGEALSRYKALGDVGEAILSTIDLDGQTPHFRLADGERCPHLDGRGLCRIISDFGEGYLCDICREHPRFYNFPGGRCEVGLGAACEEAARLILECADYSEVTELSRDEDYAEDTSDFDVLAKRADIYAILSDAKLPYSERLTQLREKYNVSPSALDDGHWRAVISSLEYLDGESEKLFLSYSSAASPTREEYAERALAYFIYRHTGSAETEDELRSSLGTAFFLERLFSSIMEKTCREDPDSASLLLRRVSEEIEYSEDNIEKIKAQYL